jgi:hypothetical protein
MTENEATHSSLDVPIAFSYRLTGVGWAEAELAAGSQTIHLTASYLSNALDDLLKAIEEVLDGSPHSEACWAEEPGQFRWDFERGASELQVRIFVEEGTRREWPEPGWEAPAGAHTNDTEEGVEFSAFSASAPVAAVAQAIADGAGRVLEQEGELGYWEEWLEARFPVDRLWRIQDILGLSRTALPDPTPHGEDPVREQLQDLWVAFLSGELSPDEAVESIESGDYRGRSKLPVVRQGVRTLRSDAQSGGWPPDAETSSAARYADWLVGLELYDRDPLAWHRQYWINRLADSIAGLSIATAIEIAEEYVGFLDRSDIEQTIRTRRPTRG